MKEETAVRTDYLLEDYDKIAAPGEAYNETTFETFLRSQPFMNVVKVGDGGVSIISRRNKKRLARSTSPSHEAGEPRASSGRLVHSGTNTRWGLRSRA